MTLDGPPDVAVVEAVRSGDVDTVQRLVQLHPELPSARGRGGRTLLHIVTDWPGFFPQGPEIAELLLSAGADPDARTAGPAGETPLHWAASSDDVEVADVLVRGGADLEAPGGSIGTPLANAVGYGCWQVARLLVERGVRVPLLWQAAALGLTARVKELMATTPAPDRAAVDEAFWHACSGGQRRTAEYLLAAGADLNSRPAYAGSSAFQAAAGADGRRGPFGDWLRQQGGSAATASDEDAPGEGCGTVRPG